MSAAQTEAELEALAARIRRAPLGELPGSAIDPELTRDALRTHDRAVQLLIERSLNPERPNTVPIWTALAIVTVGLVLEITMVAVVLVYLLILVVVLLLLSIWQLA